MRRQAYVEFDLRQMLEEQRFADLRRPLPACCTARAFGVGSDGADECLLDRYYAHSREQGDRVREHLREGVEECIQRLANGFLRHPANNELRRRVAARRPGKRAHLRRRPLSPASAPGLPAAVPARFRRPRASQPRSRLSRALRGHPIAPSARPARRVHRPRRYLAVAPRSLARAERRQAR